MPRLLALALGLALLLACAVSAPAQEAPPADPRVQPLLDSLNRILADVESESDYGQYVGWYKKNYQFLVKGGKLFVQETYEGHNRDLKTKLMEWSGVYIRMIDPAQVTVGRVEGEEYFTVACPGKEKCIPYKSMNEMTIIKGNPQGKPRSLTGLQDKVNVHAGKDKAKLDKAYQDMSELLDILRAAAAAASQGTGG